MEAVENLYLEYQKSGKSYKGPLDNPLVGKCLGALIPTIDQEMLGMLKATDLV